MTDICEGGPRHGVRFGPVNGDSIRDTGGYYVPTERHDPETGLRVWEWKSEGGNK